MKNKEIAEMFSNIADILEIKGENPFRIRAYRKAALNIDGLSETLEVIDKKGDLENIEGIGKDLANKIREYISAGKIAFYEDLKKGIPKSVIEFMDIPGVGPKTANIFYKELGIKTIKQLHQKIKAGRIKNIHGIGQKTLENILKGIDFLLKSKGRPLLAVGLEISEQIIKELARLKEVKRIEPAGSLRRRKETIGDIDLVVASEKPAPIMDKFVNLPQVKEVLAKGLTKSSVITREKIQVDLRVVKRESFGAALAYLTGSKMHNIKLRELAMKKGLKINEYGIYKVSSGKKMAGSDERDIYDCIGLSFVPPEMREDRGEIEAARKNKIPKLIEVNDIKADLHIHSEASDGSMSLEEIASACKKMGYKYIVITEHSETLKVAGGLDKKTLFKQIEKIDKLNARLKGFRILKGTEVDIRADGVLDYKDEILKELDFVIAAIHSGFKQSKELITERIIRAMENKHVNMIAHPTGRLMGVREGYEIDIHKILTKARDTNTAIEINAYPERLDLNDINCRLAKEMGVMIGIGTDAHMKGNLDNMRLGVSVARRGWLEASDVINTYSLNKFLKKVKK